jgi:hypothetical protein
VLYIAGWGRSGSTVLDKVLGQLDGFFPVGEISRIWDYSFAENRHCGCGERFRECEVWCEAIEEAYGGMDRVDARAMIRARDSGARLRHVPLLLLPSGSRSLLKGRLRRYRENLERLYEGIYRSTGSRVIVDSSKSPSYGYVLETSPKIDLRIVHLVRDPRAVAHSRLRKKVQPDTGNLMEQYSATRSAVLWSALNLMVEAFWRRAGDRFLRLRYEDFVGDPEGSVRAILDLLGERSPELPIEGRRVEFGPIHSVGGNPIRFETGKVELRLDEEWKSKMKPRDKKVVAALTWPLLRRYGYGRA